MNAVEQKKHATAVSTLEAATTDAIEAMSERLRDESDRLFDIIGDERTHRLKMAEEQRGYVDAADRRLDRLIEAETADRRAFVGRGFWSRLNWLMTGR